jgi:hypothetical protein
MSTVLVGHHVKREFVSENINSNLQKDPTFRFISVFYYFLVREVGLCKNGLGTFVCGSGMIKEAI